MGRKTNTRYPRRTQVRIVGAGITEYWYLKHLKPLLGLKYKLYPRLFGNESMTNINELIEEGLEANTHVICLFDEDVKQWNASEAQRINDLHQKYGKSENVTLCCSMPSIEYWFLLHYENTNRYFRTSYDVTKALRKYIPRFAKNEQFLRPQKWVVELVENDKTIKAKERAKKIGRTVGSYTDVWKAIEKTY